jgi:agmatine deiminase
MPAEWTPHASTWLAWPHDDDQWIGMLEPVRREFAPFVDAIARDDSVDLLVADDESERDAKRRLTSSAIRIHRVPHQDLWLRDSGPIFVARTARDRGAEAPPPRTYARGPEGPPPRTPRAARGSEGPPPGGDRGGRASALQEIALVDWDFNGWGNKYLAALDNEIPTHVAAILGGVEPFSPGLVMEGGSLEVNDGGLALTTRQCLLAPTRNAGQDEASLERALAEYLGLLHIIWLDHGLEGDHTDGHIDTLTRFVNDTTIVTSVCADTADPNHVTLAANLDVLRRARGANGEPFRVVELPIPSGRVEFEGERLPLTYANFYVTNQSVLVPVYGAPEDQQALEILKPLFPGRDVVGLSARALITGGGAFHCVTQQQPVGQLWRTP